jgi:hypothetical protein
MLQETTYSFEKLSAFRCVIFFLAYDSNHMSVISGLVFNVFAFSTP